MDKATPSQVLAATVNWFETNVWNALRSQQPATSNQQPATSNKQPATSRSETMCRNIKTLANFEPPATDDEVRASALQFVRKLSGTTKPSRANEAAFNEAVD